MKWKVRKYSDPVMGDKRTEMKWAWFPLKAVCLKQNQEYWVWMDWYTRTQEFMKYMMLMPARPAVPVCGWRTIERTVDTTDYIGKKW
jgi:hypothetical protein